MSDKNQKHFSDVLLALAGLMTPLVLAYLGHIYQEAEAKEGLHVRYVEMAIEILKDDAASHHPEFRKWAVNVLHEYSHVPIHEEAQAHLLENGLGGVKLPEPDPGINLSQRGSIAP